MKVLHILVKQYQDLHRFLCTLIALMILLTPYVTYVGKVYCDIITRSIYSLSTLLLMPILSFASLSEQRRKRKANKEAIDATVDESLA